MLSLIPVDQNISLDLKARQKHKGVFWIPLYEFVFKHNAGCKQMIQESLKAYHGQGTFQGFIVAETKSMNSIVYES